MNAEPKVEPPRCDAKSGQRWGGKDLNCALAAGHAGFHETNPGSGHNVWWPSAASATEADIVRQVRNSEAYADERARDRRYEAVELAVQALRPVAGAYDLPGLGESGERADYGDAIIELAERLGAYIQNGA